MWGLSIWHWIVVCGVVMLLFGRGMVSKTMADIGGGIRQLRNAGKEIIGDADPDHDDHGH